MERDTADKGNYSKTVLMETVKSEVGFKLEAKWVELVNPLANTTKHDSLMHCCARKPHHHEDSLESSNEDRYTFG